MYNDPKELWNITAKELQLSNSVKQHPFNTVVLATLRQYPEIRTIVKRNIDAQNNFWFYTDQRSPKIEDIKTSPLSSVLLYHPEMKLQVRIYGKITVLTKGPSYDMHRAKIINNPGDYQSLHPPGTPILQSKEERKSKAIHFALLLFIPSKWDILMLRKNNHLRAQFNAEDDYRGSWVTP